mmetsp:Transcript_16201/g.51192  ORF Transcript_16201/g.51192 Transcript_16201/m.51192 type:complete len:277 (+) Transcript_16201:314-1144(+)
MVGLLRRRQWRDGAQAGARPVPGCVRGGGGVHLRGLLHAALARPVQAAHGARDGGDAAGGGRPNHRARRLPAPLLCARRLSADEAQRRGSRRDRAGRLLQHARVPAGRARHARVRHHPRPLSDSRGEVGAGGAARVGGLGRRPREAAQPRARLEPDAAAPHFARRRARAGLPRREAHAAPLAHRGAGGGGGDARHCARRSPRRCAAAEPDARRHGGQGGARGARHRHRRRARRGPPPPLPRARARGPSRGSTRRCRGPRGARRRGGRTGASAPRGL